jgi:two-component system response regulator PhoP
LSNANKPTAIDLVNDDAAISEVQSTNRLLNFLADDSMTKPFDLGELIARARALIGRGKGQRRAVLAPSRWRRRSPWKGKGMDLSPMEYHVLEYMMHNPIHVISSRELLEHLYDFTWEHHSNVIEAHISNLRRKLRNITGQTAIDTLRRRGYRLVHFAENDPTGCG